MGEQAFNDDDASVYKNHILYYLTDDANCGRLMSVLEQHALGDDVFLQDVRQLRQRPPWLDGVPILVCRKDKQAFKGQSIYNYLRSWKPSEDDFLPASSSTGGYANFEDGETAFVGERKFASLFSSGMFNVEDDDDAGGRGGGGGPGRGGGGGGGGGGAMRAGTDMYGGGGSSSSTGQLNEKQRRRQDAEAESSMRAQQLLDARQQQDQRVQHRQGGGVPGQRTSVPMPRTAFSTSDSHAPDSSYAMRQPAQPQYSYPAPPQHQQPLHHVGGAPPNQYAPQYSQYGGAQHAPAHYSAQPQQQPQYQYHGAGGGAQTHAYGAAAPPGYGQGYSQAQGHPAYAYGYPQ